MDGNFNPMQIETIEDLSKTYNVCDAIMFVQRCHCCGAQSECEFCSEDCAEYGTSYLCLWGLECVFCGRVPVEVCDCYECCIDGDEPVNHFNRKHGTKYNVREFEMLKSCKISGETSANTESSSSHYMCFWGDDCYKCAWDNYCFPCECTECNKPMTDHEGYKDADGYSGTICNLCAAEYDFDEQELIYDYANKHNISLQHASIYLESCHGCGRDLKFGQEYCNKRCADYCEVYFYPCFRGESCLVCDAWKWHENKKQEDQDQQEDEHQDQQEEDQCKITIENIEEEEELRGEENV